MWLPRALAHVPFPLMVFILNQPSTCAAQDLPWPYNLPDHVKYYPEDEQLVKRNNDVLRRIQESKPMVVRKMSPDPNEMFFLHYWSFDEGDYSNTDGWSNISTLAEFQAPVPLHASFSHKPRLVDRYLRLPVPAANLFSKRDFVCPTGTFACTSINRPNACCPTSSTCQIVQDTGLGDVGCCDAAETCAGTLSQCPSDYSSCPNNPGGGCCLPGFACYEEGCVQTSTTVVYVTPTTSSTSTSVPSTSTSTVTDTTTVVVSPPAPSSSTQVISSTASEEPTSTIVTTTDTITSSTVSSSSTQQNILTCSSGYRSCPVSLGGGCCRTDRACGSDVCPAMDSTASLSPPVRGTSSSPSESTAVSGCPTGFYACSAYYPGGCCQVDRDCQSTSCPARTQITVVNSDSITIVAPTGTPVSQGLLTGSCAHGWSTCDGNLGGGCCPSGYACGTAACTASAGGVLATQGKIAPNAAPGSFQRLNHLEIYSVVAVLFSMFIIA